MNGILTFFKGMLSMDSVNDVPVGLKGIETNKAPKVMKKKETAKGEVKLSDLMRRPH